MNLPSYLWLVGMWAISATTPAMAGIASAPELDPGTLAAVTSSVTAAYFGFRMYQARKQSK